MDKQLNEEITYLANKYNEINYYPDRFKIFLGSDKYLCGVLSPKDKKCPLSQFTDYSTLYNTIVDLDWKIKLSFNESIKYAYSDLLKNEFNPLQSTDEESMAYYYIENSLFRTSILWDILAQIYCLFYKINISSNKIYYNKLFNTECNKYYSEYKIKKIENYEEFKNKADNINKYLCERNNTYVEGTWLGNHAYVNKCRNQMTHRNSPNITSISDYNLNFKDPPSYMLKRIIEDYVKVSNYISEILNNIEEKLDNN